LHIRPGASGVVVIIVVRVYGGTTGLC